MRCCNNKAQEEGIVMKELLFESELGVQFYKEVKDGRCVVRVKSKGQRFTHMTYTFPDVSPGFTSPFLSWQNLNCCGGWDFERAYLQTAVQERRKLYAGCSEYIDPGETREGKRAKLKELLETLPDGCAVGEEPWRNDRVFNYYICRTGALKDFFDLEQVFDAYRRLGVAVSDRERAEIREYCSAELTRFGRDEPFAYSAAETKPQLVATGLLLGYPLESTASLLSGV